MITIPNRWTKLRYHKEQQLYKHSTVRFNVVPAGRRSGKTEIAKRRLVKKALRWTGSDGFQFIAGGPTHAQSKQIFWRDLKLLIPDEFINSILESELSINLVNGAIVRVVGLDVPQRIEGPPIAHIIIDESGNQKSETWSHHIRPALSDIEFAGEADLIGVPEGRNWYYDIKQFAIADNSGQWAYFHWKSAEILPKEEIEVAKAELDPLTFQQEYEASFVVFEGLAYYTFSVANVTPVTYCSQKPLIFCFDFNVEPGVAAIIQEQEDCTCVIGEVYIPRNSRTPIVCDKLIEDWGHHKGIVYCYGDPSGGARGTAKVQGSDWDLIRQKLRGFDKVYFDVAKAQPKQRARLNAVNSRIKSMDENIHLKIDPKCKETIRDFEGVRLLQGSAGEIDKSDEKLTHLTDAIGYYIHKKFPVVPRRTETVQI